MSHTNFSPVQNGFRFINRFEIPFPVKYTLPIFGEVDLSKVVFGLCGGMCFSVLDYFYAGARLPLYGTPEEVDRKLFTYLCERQLDSLNIPVLVKVIDWMLSENSTLAARMSRYELPKLRRALDQGKPAVLALIRVQGTGDPTQNHQVLATDYELDPATNVIRICLYDPNHPGQEPELILDLSKSRSAVPIAQSTGEPLRGFFVIPYQPQKNVPQPFLEEPQRELRPTRSAEEVQLHWPVDSRRVNQFFGENPDTYKPFGLPGHEGLDLFALSGANVYASADGEVYEADHPRDHPYGLHIRIQHTINLRTFRTVYAHLSEVFVKPGQRVAAGDRIALADNSGNSFGSHLHLTLKIDGEQTPGYPAGIVDPWPYLQEMQVAPNQTVVETGGLVAYSSSEVNLYSAQEVDAAVAALVPAAEPLTVLGDVEAARKKIGVPGEWLQVETTGGTTGFVETQLVQNADQAFPPSDLVIYPFDSLNLRSGPGTAFNLLTTLSAEAPLTVLGDADRARARLGQQGEWIQVQTQEGLRGFVAAWLVHRTGQTAPATGLVVFPTDVLNLRVRPSTNDNILAVVTPSDPLTVLGDKDQAQASIGQTDRWLNVRTPSKFAGFVAAWLVTQSGGSPVSGGTSGSGLTVFPTDDVNMRAQASLNSPRVNGAFKNESLQVIDSDLTAAQGKIGQEDQWLYVQKKDGSRGWIAAWLLSTAPA